MGYLLKQREGRNELTKKASRESIILSQRELLPIFFLFTHSVYGERGREKGRERELT